MQRAAKEHAAAGELLIRVAPCPAWWMSSQSFATSTPIKIWCVTIPAPVLRGMRYMPSQLFRLTISGANGSQLKAGTETQEAHGMPSACKA